MQTTKQWGSSSQSVVFVPVQLKIWPFEQLVETWQGAQFFRTPLQVTKSKPELQLPVELEQEMLGLKGPQSLVTVQVPLSAEPPGDSEGSLGAKIRARSSSAEAEPGAGSRAAA